MSTELPCPVETLLEPGQRGGDPRILIAQPQGELDRERGPQPGVVVGGEHLGYRLRGLACGTEQAIGKAIRLLARGIVARDLFGEASKVLDQHDPQRDRDRPEFADGEPVRLLVGVPRNRTASSASKWLSVCATKAQARPNTRG